MRLKVLYLVVLVSGCVMGAGFVSGSELWMFFGKYGLYALPLILFFVIIFTSGIYKVMTLKQKYSINNLTELSMIISPRFGKYVDYVLKVSYIIFASAMLAGIRVVGGEITVWVTLLISVLVVILNKKTLMKLNLFLVPIVIVFILTLLTLNQENIDLQNLITSDEPVLIGVIAIIFYASVNLLLSVGALLRSYTTLSKKATFWVALISGVLLASLAIVVIILISSATFNTLELPIVGVALASGSVVSVIGELLVVASILTTFIACVFGVSNDKNNKLELFLVLSVIYVLSTFGFYHVLQFGYFIIGIFSFIYYIALMRKS